MNMRNFICGLWGALLLAPVFAGQDIKPKVFTENSNVCFVGDSITHGGMYVKDIVLFYVTRFPNLKINFYNVGISGDVIQNVNARMEADVLSNKPNFATLMIGMNNVGVFKKPNITDAYAKRVEANRKMYKENLKAIVDKFQKANCELILLTPSIYDETMISKEKPANIGKNAELGYFSKHIKTVAKTRNLKLIDMYGFALEINKKYQKEFPEESIVGTDRVHPRALGGHMMMTKFIDSIGEAEYVYNLRLDAKNKSAKKSFNVDVENLKFSDSFISFSLKEYALPYPLSREAERAEIYVNFSKYNKQIFAIDGLSKGVYELFIDGKSVGKFSSDDLSIGINLAENKSTPQYAQSMEVLRVANLCREAWNDLRKINAVEMWLKLGNIKTDAEKIAKVKAMLDAKEKVSALKHPYINKCAKEYLKTKPNHARIYKKSRDMFDELYKTAKAKSHKYELIKCGI